MTGPDSFPQQKHDVFTFDRSWKYPNNFSPVESTGTGEKLLGPALLHRAAADFWSHASRRLFLLFSSGKMN